MIRKDSDGQSIYLLWDASVIVPYYVPAASKNKTAVKRSRIILDAIRHHRLNAFCFMPSIVVAEVFTVLDKQTYSGWDSQVFRCYGSRESGSHLDRRTFKRVREEFRRDIHNGALFYQYDLNRYHILALDLISPIDKYRKFYRRKKVYSMGASDLLISSMAIHLAKIHGRENFFLLTADERMVNILGRVCPKLNASTAASLGLVTMAKKYGFGSWTPGLYPRVLDLERAKDEELKNVFGSWPLSTRRMRGREPKA